MKKQNQKGFSLVELLVVVIIIGIIAAIAIPSLLASRKAANESSAIANLRTAHSANVTYQATSGNGTAFAADLGTMSTGGLLDNTWTGAPVKNGYTFTYTTVSGNATYCLTAVPTAGSGDHAYAISSLGVIYKSANTTAPTCAAGTGVISSGTVLGG